MLILILSPIPLHRTNLSPSISDIDLADLIERAQFALNAKIYRPGEFEELEKLGFEGSWLQWFLFEIECFHGECSFCSYVGLLVDEGR
jgi:hypothetical protein